MTPDQIKQLAKQAGGTPFSDRYYPDDTAVAFGPTALAEFVRLVRESVLKEAAELCHCISMQENGDAMGCEIKIRKMK